MSRSLASNGFVFLFFFTIVHSFVTLSSFSSFVFLFFLFYDIFSFLRNRRRLRHVLFFAYHSRGFFYAIFKTKKKKRLKSNNSNNNNNNNNKRRRGTRKAGKGGMFHPFGLGTLICVALDSSLPLRPMPAVVALSYFESFEFFSFFLLLSRCRVTWRKNEGRRKGVG